jgi:hypothetical protein
LIGIPFCSYLLRSQQQYQSLYRRHPQQPSNSSGTNAFEQQENMMVYLGSAYYHDSILISNWTIIALFGVWISFIAASATYFYVTDFIDHVNQPQNPMNDQLLDEFDQT